MRQNADQEFDELQGRARLEELLAKRRAALLDPMPKDQIPPNIRDLLDLLSKRGLTQVSLNITPLGTCATEGEGTGIYAVINAGEKSLDPAVLLTGLARGYAQQMHLIFEAISRLTAGDPVRAALLMSGVLKVGNQMAGDLMSGKIESVSGEEKCDDAKKS